MEFFKYICALIPENHDPVADKEGRIAYFHGETGGSRVTGKPEMIKQSIT